MLSEERQELEATIDGLRLVLSIALNALPHDHALARLQVVEAEARRKNLRSETIKVIRKFRETWESKLAD